MGRASDAPMVASGGTRAEPRTPATWLLSAVRSQTAAPLPADSDPRSEPRNEPTLPDFHPPPSRPKGYLCRSFTPAQPDNPVATIHPVGSGLSAIANQGS